jgi:hypothetical protein
VASPQPVVLTLLVQVPAVCWHAVDWLLCALPCTPAVLCCAVPCCAVPCCAVLCRAVLCCALQLASNSSEFVSSLTFAARKRRKNMSLTLSQVGGWDLGWVGGWGGWVGPGAGWDLGWVAGWLSGWVGGTWDDMCDRRCLSPNAAVGV